MSNPLTLSTMQSSARWGRGIAAIGLSSVLLAVSAKIEIPFWPVPMTLETLAVLGLAGVLGARLAGLAILLWCAEGAVGLPVFAGPAAGPSYFLGPTAGYLVGFLLAALVVGWAADRGLRTRPAVLFVAMLGGNALIYVAGVTYLAYLVGWLKAIHLGLLPFILADLTKAALASAGVTAANRLGFGCGTLGRADGP